MKNYLKAALVTNIAILLLSACSGEDTTEAPLLEESGSVRYEVTFPSPDSTEIFGLIRILSYNRDEVSLTYTNTGQTEREMDGIWEGFILQKNTMKHTFQTSDGLNYADLTLYPKGFISDSYSMPFTVKGFKNDQQVGEVSKVLSKDSMFIHLIIDFKEARMRVSILDE